MVAPSASCGAVAAAGAGLGLGHGELDELVAEDGGAVDGGAHVGRDAHAVVEGERHLGLVAVEGDGGDRADGDVGQLHLGAVGQVADVAEDGGGRALGRPARAAGQAEGADQGGGGDGEEAAVGRAASEPPPRHATTASAGRGWAVLWAWSGSAAGARAARRPGRSGSGRTALRRRWPRPRRTWRRAAVWRPGRPRWRAGRPTAEPSAARPIRSCGAAEDDVEQTAGVGRGRRGRRWSSSWWWAPTAPCSSDDGVRGRRRRAGGARAAAAGAPAICLRPLCMSDCAVVEPPCAGQRVEDGGDVC